MIHSVITRKPQSPIEWVFTRNNRNRYITGNSLEFNSLHLSMLKAFIIGGNTIETGTGTKSPDNQYVLSGTTKINANGVDYLWSRPGYSLPNGTHDTKNFISGVETHNVGKAILNGTESWFVRSYSNTVATGFGLTVSDMKYLSVIESTHFTYSSTSTGLAINQIHCDYQNNIYPSINNTLVGILSTDTDTQKIAKWKTWLAANPITILYELQNPQIINTAPLVHQLSAHNVITNDNNAVMHVEF